MPRKRFKVKPTVRVNYHDEDGNIEREDVDLSEMLTTQSQHDAGHEVNTQMDIPDEDEKPTDEEENNEGGRSSYYHKVEKKEKAWESLRELMAKRTLCFAGKRITNHQCIQCGMEGKFKCTDCGPLATFCQDCLLKMHSNTNVFHHVEVFKNGIFFPYKLQTLLVYDCPCKTVRHMRSIAVVSVKGVFCDIDVQFCSCCPEFVQLLQFSLWGGTPTKPRTVFSIELLEFIHAFQMECQASLKSICQALEIFNHDKILIGSHKMYPIIIDAFEEYRLYRHKLSTLQCVSPELDGGNICPACPKDDGVVFESLDALFIGRRKNAGQSCRNPLFGELMFYNQQQVDQFVTQYSAPTLNTQDCHDFLAGSAVRSMNRYKALDETAIFGRGCRHEFPKKFLNLKHGERLAYAVYVLQELEKDNAENPGLKINILYDIACILVKHLENLNEDPILDMFQFAIPIFHCYGHNGQCQIKFSPRRKEGFGLTDGEMLERVWAYVRRFGKMTKEMRPSHRVDVLSDVLLHYGMKTKKKIGSMLAERMEKALNIESSTKCDIEKLFQCLGSSNISAEEIRSWVNDELNFFTNEDEVEEHPWKCKYVIYLDLYYDLYDRWNSCADPNQLTVRFNQMKKIAEELETMERENTVGVRWQPGDQQYQEAKRDLVTKKTKALLLKIKKKVVVRWFLLSLKSKYSDGQALATRLSKQINRVSKELKKEIKVFNEVNRLPFSNLQTLTFDEVKDPDSEFWLALHTASPDDRNECPVPLGVKRKAIELQNLMDRSREEQILIKKEMENTWKYFFNQHQVVTQFLVTLANHERLLDVERGEEMFARKKLLGIEVTLSQLQSQLSGYITVEQPEFHFVGNLDFHDNDIEPGTDDEEEITVCADLNDSESESSEEEYDNDSANDDDGLDVD